VLVSPDGLLGIWEKLLALLLRRRTPPPVATPPESVAPVN